MLPECIIKLRGCPLVKLKLKYFYKDLTGSNNQITQLNFKIDPYIWLFATKRGAGEVERGRIINSSFKLFTLMSFASCMT